MNQTSTAEQICLAPYAPAATGSSLRQSLASKGPDCWLWCLYCHRFFQARDLTPDFMGNYEGCAFCGAAGLDVAVFDWDTWKSPREPWPESTDGLRRGMRLKIYTLRREVLLHDETCQAAVYIDPTDRWVYILTTGSREIIMALSASERRAALRGYWGPAERKARRFANNPDRFRRRWLTELDLRLLR